jgi:phage FluMu protein Com
MTVSVSVATGTKCQRCWKILEEVGFHADYPDACFRCARVLEPDTSVHDMAVMRWDWFFKKHCAAGHPVNTAIVKAGAANVDSDAPRLHPTVR